MLERDPAATWFDLIDAGLLDSAALIHPERILPSSVDSTRLDLVEEFRRSPLGPHSADLEQLLWVLRSQCPRGRYVLTTDHQESPRYRVAKLHPVRGSAPEYIQGAEFDSLEDAEWAAFALRWGDHTGEAMSLQRSAAT